MTYTNIARASELNPDLTAPENLELFKFEKAAEVFGWRELSRRLGKTGDQPEEIKFGRSLVGRGGVELYGVVSIIFSQGEFASLSVEVSGDYGDPAKRRATAARWRVEKSEEVSTLLAAFYAALQRLPALIRVASEKTKGSVSASARVSTLRSLPTFTPINQFFTGRHPPSEIREWVAQFLPEGVEGLMAVLDLMSGIAARLDSRVEREEGEEGSEYEELPEVDLKTSPSSVAELMAHLAPVLDNLPDEVVRDVITALGDLAESLSASRSLSPQPR